MKDTETLIRELEEQRYQAMLDADVGTLDRLLAQEVLYSHSNGERDGKGAYLDKVASGYFRYLAIARPEEEVVVLGATAIVAGRMVADVAVAGDIRHLDNRSLAVWAERGARWQFLAYQPTVMPKTSAKTS